MESKKPTSTKSSLSRQIDRRVFDQNADFPTFVDLTPIIKTQKPSKSFTPKEDTQLQVFKADMLKRIHVLEKNLKWLLKCLQQVVKDNNVQYKNLLQKIQEFQKNDAQVEELIERHTVIVQEFQQKIKALQNVIEQQEVKLITTQAALNEAHQHLEKIKHDTSSI